MNKQSNVYTLIYIIVLVIVVGAGLAIATISLKPRQIENANKDKMRQILAAVNIEVPSDSIISAYNRYITDTYVIRQDGSRIEDAVAFDVNVSKQSKMTADERELPVYVCHLDNGDEKYILPMYGAGLWGPIWGYVSVNTDGSTIYGAYFAHQGETPGLGAEIEKSEFSDQFQGKQLIKNNRFVAVDVLKAGQKPVGDEDYVDAISGGTITSRGVATMINNSLTPYSHFLENLRNK